MKDEKASFRRPGERKHTLLALQNLKMARPAHAYVRGSTLQFYRWLRDDGHSIRVAPSVWICADCHVGNLGSVANAKGAIDIQIRDLDQSVIGNPAHDLIRLALSLAAAARGSDLPGVTTATMLEEMMAGYERALVSRPRSGADLAPKPESVRVVMRQAVQRTWKHLAKERLEDIKPRIPWGERFWPLSNAEKEEVRRLFALEDVRRLVTAVKSRKDGARVDVLDAAYWMKGCSSLARLRFAVLTGIGKANKPDDYASSTFKEAVLAAAPRAPRAKCPATTQSGLLKGRCNSHPILANG